LLAEQLLEEVAVERECLCAPFGKWRVVLIHVCRDVVEEQGGRVRRCRRRLDLDEIDAALLERAEKVLQRREVEHVLKALAVRLEDHREVGVAPGDLEQALGLEALLPERRSLSGPPAGDQERASRVLAEAGSEE